MKFFITTLLVMAFSLNSDIIFDFSSNSDVQNWRIVDDVVMGGRSNGEFSVSKDGHGVFSGEVSLENNGGFSSVRYFMNDMPIKPENNIRIRLKGDGKTYQLRIKNNRRYEYAYMHEFKTTGEWQEIEVQANEMYPIYRGNRLNRPNYNHDSINELSFLIGNGKPETFQLLIDRIEVVE